MQQVLFIVVIQPLLMKNVQSTIKKVLPKVYYLCHQRHSSEPSLISWFHCVLGARLSLPLS